MPGRHHCREQPDGRRHARSRERRWRASTGSTNLPPGSTTIAAELAGFSRFERPGIVVRAGFNLVVDVSLKVGSLEETVQVTAETPMLDVDKPVQAVNISG